MRLFSSLLFSQIFLNIWGNSNICYVSYSIMENAWNHIPAVIEAQLQFSYEKSFGTTLFLLLLQLFFLIIKKIKTNINVSGEKRFAFEKMQLHQIGTNTCRLFIIVTIICLCGLCNTSLNIRKLLFSTADDDDFYDFQKKQCCFLQQFKPMCASVLISSFCFLYPLHRTRSYGWPTACICKYPLLVPTWGFSLYGCHFPY